MRRRRRDFRAAREAAKERASMSRGGRISLMANKSGLANYKIILYAQEGGGWVAEIPAIGGCYALMDTREEALKELEKVFRMIQEEYAESGKPLPADRTELLVHA
jgi:antitoxin HicB